MYWFKNVCSILFLSFILFCVCFVVVVVFVTMRMWIAKCTFNCGLHFNCTFTAPNLHLEDLKWPSWWKCTHKKNTGRKGTIWYQCQAVVRVPCLAVCACIMLYSGPVLYIWYQCQAVGIAIQYLHTSCCVQDLCLTYNINARWWLLFHALQYVHISCLVWNPCF